MSAHAVWRQEPRSSDFWPTTRIRERRGGRRLPIEVEVDVEGAAERFRSTSVDLSPGGMFVMTHHALPVGVNVVLAFTLPNGVELHVVGVVQWRRDDGRGAEPAGIGISFFFLDPEVREILEAFCAVREPLYLDRVRTLDDFWDIDEPGNGEPLL
jgi:uncharacterized protein (TIGR02266 family)